MNCPTCSNKLYWYAKGVFNCTACGYKMYSHNIITHESQIKSKDKKESRFKMIKKII